MSVEPIDVDASPKWRRKRIGEVRGRAVKPKSYARIGLFVSDQGLWVPVGAESVLVRAEGLRYA